jgi:hypothetical protein
MVHPFQQVFETIEPVLPEPVHLACPIDQGGKRAEPRAVVGLSTFMPVGYQPGLFQNAEVLRHCRLGYSGQSGQCSDRLLSFAAQLLEDRPASRIGQRSEEDVMGPRHHDQ